jgi:hypothetical protein
VQFRCVSPVRTDLETYVAGMNKCKGMLAELTVATQTGAQVSWTFNEIVWCNRSP